MTGLPGNMCDCCFVMAAKRWSVEVAGSLILVCGKCKDAIELFIERLGK